ncbi:hypothetical protein Ocin01_13731 [Orchesella cincta]|uniref:Uncharacterized protein n=1 Tax=Orchesella cincta TaxID=48709 RepID=A0A1D2MIX2_ORCCI|nr:hypothetical protein Ocin01_13731 [Orchesella cincta]
MGKVDFLGKVYAWTVIAVILVGTFVLVGMNWYKEHHMDGNMATETPDDQTHKLNSSLMSKNITKVESILVAISTTDSPLNVTEVPEVLQVVEVRKNGTITKGRVKRESHDNQWNLHLINLVVERISPNDKLEQQHLKSNLLNHSFTH